jgi:aminocarboxymuconate-semialdehyde decarboxylase
MTTEPWEAWAKRWGPSMVPRPPVRTIDVHTHLAVPESAEITRPHFQPESDPRTFFSSPETKSLNQKYHHEVHGKFTDPEVRIADMDALGIDVQLVAMAPFQYFYWADESLSPRVARLQNDRVAGQLGFPGIEVGADVNGLDLDDARFAVLWAELEELGLVVVLHPAGFTEGRRMTDYYLVNVIGMPLSSTLAVTRMILGGVFERHPELKMLVVHGGGYLPFYPARTDHAFRHRPEMRRHIDRLPSDYLSRLFFDITVFDAGMVEQLVRSYGADHVLLGTDYPFDMGLPDPLALVAEARLTEAERDLVIGGSAARLFRIEN